MKYSRITTVMMCGLIGLTTLVALVSCSEATQASRVITYPGPASVVISTESLLDEMVNLPRLTRLPEPAYTTKQFSSYDRRSESPSKKRTWFANGDRGHYLRIEEKGGRKEHVMMDVDGPGAVVRIWSANPAGTLRIYLDGNDTPTIEADMKALLGGNVPGLPVPIAGVRAMGWNLYFPISYAQHCKVTSDEGDFYYHVNYRTYGVDTSVESFSSDDLERLADKINQIATRLAAPRQGGEWPGDQKETPFNVTVPPDGNAQLWQETGPKAICRFLVHLQADDLDEAARSIVLEMTFDGQKTVEVPIGDFFGTAPGLTPYESLPLGITNDHPQELWCHWWMPFGKNARISVRNLGHQAVRMHGAVATVPYRWDDKSLLFHAKWRIERGIPTRPFSDWPHLECSGNGRFVGGALRIINPSIKWWGEGDEKIYVDGETFPSHFGTGTEDYYGYAWCRPDRFVHAYHNQPRCDGPGNYGNTSVNRFHFIDDIPFTRSFKFDIENWHSQTGIKTTRSAVSYWYARPGGSDFFKPITKEDIQKIDVPLFDVHRVPGAIEAETMPILAETGATRSQWYDKNFSNHTHLRWMDNKPGDRLVLGFNSDTADNQHVIVRLTKAPHNGQVQLYVNGIKAGEPIDLFAKPPVPDDEIDLGAFDLKKGQNRLTLEVVGANPKTVKDFYRVGIDYLRLK